MPHRTARHVSGGRHRMAKNEVSSRIWPMMHRTDGQQASPRAVGSLDEVFQGQEKGRGCWKDGSYVLVGGHDIKECNVSFPQRRRAVIEKLAG